MGSEKRGRVDHPGRNKNTLTVKGSAVRAMEENNFYESLLRLTVIIARHVISPQQKGRKQTMRERILLTPSLAKDMLDHNYEHNRKVRNSVVAKYASDIKEGRWNSEVSRFQDPIIVSKAGRLLNGQHRCMAVIEANTPIYIYIERDVDEDIFRYLDDGEKRGASDYVTLPSAHSSAHMARIMYAIENSDVPLSSALDGRCSAKGGVVARQQVLSKIDEDPERVIEYVRLGAKAAKYFGKKRGAFSTALFIIDYCGRGDVISRFVEECSAMVPSSRAVIALRSYATKCLSQPGFRGDTKWVCGCVFYAYEVFRTNGEIKSFNKFNIYFSRYDKYVNETRNRLKDKAKTL